MRAFLTLAPPFSRFVLGPLLGAVLPGVESGISLDTESGFTPNSDSTKTFHFHSKPRSRTADSVPRTYIAPHARSVINTVVLLDTQLRSTRVVQTAHHTTDTHFLQFPYYFTLAPFPSTLHQTDLCKTIQRAVFNHNARGLLRRSRLLIGSSMRPPILDQTDSTSRGQSGSNCTSLDHRRTSSLRLTH